MLNGTGASEEGRFIRQIYLTERQSRESTRLKRIAPKVILGEKKFKKTLIVSSNSVSGSS
jgi:hypothetical protein